MGLALIGPVLMLCHNAHCIVLHCNQSCTRSAAVCYRESLKGGKASSGLVLRLIYKLKTTQCCKRLHLCSAPLGTHACPYRRGHLACSVGIRAYICQHDICIFGDDELACRHFWGKKLALNGLPVLDSSIFSRRTAISIYNLHALSVLQ